jgi:hypothetical protein
MFISFVVLIIVYSTANAAGPTATVHLRVEGVTNTIFEDDISTEGHIVTTESGGTHKCDGTNHNTSLISGPTATSALDSASKQGKFTWDG